MTDSQSTHHSGGEIIIVKKRKSGEHGHHGGAWKIAYADFMTAMMAFFLVMWLINAANDETKAAVASYFNPIRLTDNKPAERGLKQQDEASVGDEVEFLSDSQEAGYKAGQMTGGGDDIDSAAGEESQYSDADFFENPYSVLSEIALETGRQKNVSAAGDGGANMSGPATGASGGEAYRDPFDPDFWSKSVDIETSSDITETGVERTIPRAETNDAIKQALEAAGAGLAALEQSQDEEQEASDAKTGRLTAEGQSDAEEPGEPLTEEQQAEREKQEVDPEEQEAGEFKESIETALAEEQIQLGEGLTVAPVDGGLLVSLTDELKGGMFNVGSAVPKRDMVLAMEKIGQLLAERDGTVIIRGHTDARPFARADNDNWKLSMARAHSAFFMLVRGGLDEKRIKEVSGQADRRLKIPEDPLADANRRIEILIQRPAG
ncbi:MotB family protein [Hoeflea prorocentri]|uniref:MotB family protein n=1 Tax=Hoeflea prorocentri TaxID=1922333 RepID=A0A9X3UL25_9HYPH|nr:MotB family protein [Hoeflea prorocentri]MCY6382385.1 MotB family protein [Hoeflea prorocentri]MDA5400185.1 MotB family protein [Hoeflea prorocentri]